MVERKVLNKLGKLRINILIKVVESGPEYVNP